MRRISIFTAAAVMALGLTTVAFADPQTATPTASAPTAQAPAAKPGKREPKPDDTICEEDAAVTGSMLTHRVCKTRAQREADTQSAADGLRRNDRTSAAIQGKP